MSEIRTFESGATRDTDEGKLDYEAFFSYPVLQRYAEYLHKHRVQPDGKLRDGDNWQKGIPRAVLAKSMWRHFMETWAIHRGYGDPESLEEALCALMFNTMAYLHETLKQYPHNWPRVEETTKDLVEAQILATWIWRNFYGDEAPDWEVCDSITGVLSQISNMLTGLERKREVEP